jgi:RNA polymerase sigma factor (TIGR02999 family)
VLLRAWQGGDRAALDELMPAVYAELRRLAAAHMRRERSEHTLSPTALVSEAFVRMGGDSLPAISTRNHFFALAARQMRQILVDHARKRSADKRGGGERMVELDEALASAARPADFLALDDALTSLGAVDERAAHAVELRYFGGLGHEEIAEILGVASKTVQRDLRAAVAWLRRHLSAS